MATGGVDNAVHMVDLRRNPDDQVFRKNGKVVPHITSSMTKIRFDDEFMICGSKDGSLSVVEF